MFTSLFQLEQKPVTVFSSADVGAPTLTADIGSLKTLLKACLVTGYGSKQGLGWQMAFESTDKNSAAFKSADPTASGFYFKIDNSTTGTAKLSAYQNMTDINTGIRPIVVDNQYSLKDSQWRLIGHGKAFVLLLDVVMTGARFAYPILFGDLPREKKRVEPVCVLWCARTGTNIYSGGVQHTLFILYNGNAGIAGNTNVTQTASYPFVVNNGTASSNLTLNCCRFKHDSLYAVSVLFEPVFCALPDSTWTFLPMLQPLSMPIGDTSNLGLLSATAIKAKTGSYIQAGIDNTDCAIPTDWWYA